MGVQLPGTTNEQCKKFEQYLALLLKWNKVHNLTAIRDTGDVVNRHFLESTALLPHLGSPKSVLDLGTGAGFPGLPLAIMRPDWRVTVLDSASKKIVFCQEVIRACGLSKAHAVCSRAEQKETHDQLGHFDLVISRATWSMADYLPIAIPYATQNGGRIIALKGPRYSEEMTQLPSLPFNVHGPNIIPFSVPGHSEQNLTLIEYTVS